MKRSILVSSMVLAGMASSMAHAEPLEVALLQEAIYSGKTFLDLRLRAEWADYDNATQEAHAETLRTVLGYKTGDYRGVTAFVEFENVSNMGHEDYNSTINGNVAFGTIADPEVARVNQVFLEGYGFKLGRQKIVFDNARFVGDVGWRQNDQTFDAISYSNKNLVKDLSVTLDYVSKIHPITGVVSPVRAPMANVKYAAFPAAKVAAFFYAVDEQRTPAASWQHVGARVDGVIGDFLYEVSFADQSDHADSTATVDASYSDIQLGYTFGPVTVKAQQEVLEKGFKTPLATLHAFNGWADRFLATPANGLEDVNVKVLTKLSDYSVVLAVHDFQAEATGDKYGQEVDFSVSKPLTSKLTAMLKASDFNADGKAAGFLNDTTKVWLQFAYKM
jgi:hypothetical protein